MVEPLFTSRSDAWLRAGLVGLFAVIASVPALALAWTHTPYFSAVAREVEQPVKFDHRHHVRDNGIDCLYCHAGAERSAYAGIPATSVCMGCHDQVWPTSPELAAVRESYFGGTPIRWQRVSRLPEFVFFNHSIHVAKGVGCTSCHGRVDQMSQVYAAEPLTMRWCLDCHRNPEPHLVPRDHVTDVSWVARGGDEGHALAKALDVSPATDCTTCHR